MAIDYYHDLYPADDPRDGARLYRYTAAGEIQEADYRDVIGVGSGRMVLRGSLAAAAHLTPEGEQYVRVVRDDGSTEVVVGGYWTNQLKYAAAVKHETKRLEVGGAGVMAYLARSVMAPHTYIHGVFTGQDPFDRIWRLYAQGDPAGGDFLGAILWRVIYEAQHFRSGSSTYTHKHADGEIYTDNHDDDRRRSAIPHLVMGFDQFEDSDGNPWTMPSGNFTAAVKENVLQVVRRLMEAGLYVEMDPDTFELRAWEGNDHRRDRTGGAWGAAVVRLQAPTDGTTATGNIKSDSERLISSHVRRTTIWAGGGDDVYGFADTPTGTPWEGAVDSDAADVTALDNLADTQMAARSEAGDVLTARLKLGQAPASGTYLPWEHVKLDDLITVHTGTGDWDYNEAEYPVSALRIHLRDGGDWDAWVDLGASYEAMAQRQFEIAAAGAHTHPPNPQLCRAGTSISPTWADAVIGVGDNVPDIDYSHPGGDFTFIAFTWGSNNDVSNAPRWMYNLNGAGPDLEQTFAAVDSSASPAIWILNGPNASVGSGTEFRITDGSNTDGVLLAVAVVHGSYDAGDLRDWARANGSGTASSVTVDTEAGDLIVDFAEYDQNNLPGFVIDPTAGQSEDATASMNQAFGQRDVATSIGHRTATGGAEAMTWGNFSASGPWDAAAVVIPAAGVAGDGPIELIGTSVRASRCDHNHLVEALLTDEDDTALRLAPDGAGGVSWETTTTIVDLDDLTDVVITAPAEDDTLRYVGGEWINDNRRWEAVTDGEDVFVWDGDDLVHEWKVY